MDEAQNMDVCEPGTKGGVLVTGGTGFIGGALVPHFLSMGYRVSVFTRDITRAQKLLPKSVRCVNRLRHLDSDAVSAGVVNLAGANLAAKRWSAAYKSHILASRVQLTKNLVDWFAELPTPPRCLISGSAIGFYGDHGDDILTESSKPALGFSHALCRDWEQAARAAEAVGTRVCLARLGVVMDARGGAFEQMLLPYRFKLGVTLGRGDNWLSWIYRADAVRALAFLLEDDNSAGVFNLCAPEPVRVSEFAAQLRQRWPVVIKCSAPGFLLRLGLGEFASEVLLASQRVMPEHLQAVGYDFTLPNVAALLDYLAVSLGAKSMDR